MGKSFTEYAGRGFWTRDAALETVLALLTAELEPVWQHDDALSAVLDDWALQASAGFIGCVSADLDRQLAGAGLAPAVAAALRRIAAGLPPEGLVEAADPGFRRRARRACGSQPAQTPAALAGWVREVACALADLLGGQLPADPDGGAWFVDGDGRRLLPRTRPAQGRQ